MRVTVDAERTTVDVTAARPDAVLFVLAHGAGGSKKDPLIVGLTAALVKRGHGVARFDFLYRAAGRKMPDRADKLEATYRAVLEGLRGRGSKLIIGGKSMGGRMATHLAAAGDACDGVLLLGYPLTKAARPKPTSRPAQSRSEHLPKIPVPVLFVQGTRDPLCALDELRPVIDRMGARASLHVVDGGDHSLDVPKAMKRTRAQVVAEVADVIDAWLRGLS